MRTQTYLFVTIFAATTAMVQSAAAQDPGKTSFAAIKK